MMPKMHIHKGVVLVLEVVLAPVPEPAVYEDSYYHHCYYVGAGVDVGRDGDEAGSNMVGTCAVDDKDKYHQYEGAEPRGHLMQILD